MTGYGRKGRPRKSTELSTRGAAVRPSVAASLARPIVAVLLYVRAVTIVEDQATGQPVADVDPVVMDVVYGDAYDEARDHSFVGMEFRPSVLGSKADLATITSRFDDWLIVKQQALEQLGETPMRPFVHRPGGPEPRESRGSPVEGIIIAYLWRIFHAKGPGEAGAAPHQNTPWLRPSSRVRAEQRSMFGEEKVNLAYEAYEANKPRRPPITTV